MRQDILHQVCDLLQTANQEQEAQIECLAKELQVTKNIAQTALEQNDKLKNAIHRFLSEVEMI